MPDLDWGKQRRYGDYAIVVANDGRLKLLGEGAFGKTYEGVRLDRFAGEVVEQKAAIKVLNPSLLTSEAKRAQLVREVNALKQLRHANLIQYLLCGEESGEMYYAMELCQGGHLINLVRRFGALPERAAALIALQVASGLKEVHQRLGLIHRDIKPANIMLADALPPEMDPEQLCNRLEAQENLCRIVDFGLVDSAAESRDGAGFAGTLMFASPEQFLEQPVDFRCDIYSLGMTIWFLLQGKGPLLDASGKMLRDRASTVDRHLAPEAHSDYFPSRMSPELRKVLRRMVAKKPADRFTNASELQKALQEYVTDTATRRRLRHAPPPEAGFPLSRSAEPLTSLYDVNESLPARGRLRAYTAVEKKSGERVRVCTAAASEEIGGDDASMRLAENLCRIAAICTDPERPKSILSVRKVIWTADLLVSVEDFPLSLSVSDVLKARATAPRSINFSDATAVLSPIADGLDYLYQSGFEDVSLGCGDLLLVPGPSYDWCKTAHSEWNEFEARFSAIKACFTDERVEGNPYETFHGSTLDGTMRVAGSGHAASTFARIVYRVLTGGELAAAAQLSRSAYVPTPMLSAASNALVRDLVARRIEPRGAADVLRELCGYEAILRQHQAISSAGNRPSERNLDGVAARIVPDAERPRRSEAANGEQPRVGCRR